MNHLHGIAVRRGLTTLGGGSAVCEPDPVRPRGWDGCNGSRLPAVVIGIRETRDSSWSRLGGTRLPHLLYCRSREMICCERDPDGDVAAVSIAE
jgi:hypothetical protein